MINRLFPTLLFFICFFYSLPQTAKAQNNEWENPAKYEWNKERPHADFRLYEQAVDDLMETDFLRIKENFTLGDIVHIISTARRNIFPVIDNFGHLLGVVQLDDLREDMFKHEKYGHPISDYMIQPPDKILEHESIQGVMEKFEDKHTWMLPVVDKQNRYLGFISKSRILNAYREQLVKIQQ